MNLVIDDQSPILAIEDLEVEEVFMLMFVIGQNLVGRDRDGAYLLDLSTIFADIVGLHPRLIQNLVAPLTQGRDIGYEDKRVLARERHDAQTDHCLARSARQNENARSSLCASSRMKHRNSVALVFPKMELLSPERPGPQLDAQGLAVHVAR